MPLDTLYAAGYECKKLQNKIKESKNVFKEENDIVPIDLMKDNDDTSCGNFED